jgi:hypothetical protein
MLSKNECKVLWNFVAYFVVNIDRTGNSTKTIITKCAELEWLCTSPEFASNADARRLSEIIRALPVLDISYDSVPYAARDKSFYQMTWRREYFLLRFRQNSLHIIWVTNSHWSDTRRLLRQKQRTTTGAVNLYWQIVAITNRWLLKRNRL